MVTGTTDGTTARIYVDGVLKNSATVTANTTTTITVSPPFGNTPTPGEVIWLRDYQPPGNYPNFL